MSVGSERSLPLRRWPSYQAAQLPTPNAYLPSATTTKIENGGQIERTPRKTESAPRRHESLIMAIIVTGGSGFIGSNFILYSLNRDDEPIVNIDKLTYAGNQSNLLSISNKRNYKFVRASIGDASAVKDLLSRDSIRAVVNFAAESHVDRSISHPEIFFENNVLETLRLLGCHQGLLLIRWRAQKERFRFLHISTDEVFGTLRAEEPAFTEASQYRPNSPYAASKAASDHLVRAYGETYGLPVITTNCSNNYGPYQFPEKLIPLIIHNALQGKILPVYGDGKQVRDWLFVEDHCSAIHRVLASRTDQARPTISAAIAKSRTSRSCDAICDILDSERPRHRWPLLCRADNTSSRTAPDMTVDMPSMQARSTSELGWAPRETFESGIRKTVRWYLDNPAWVADVTQRRIS